MRSRELESGVPGGPLRAVHVQGVAHRLAVFFSRFRLAGDAVQVGGPLKFVGSGAESGLVKEPPADVVADVGFLLRCSDCSECLFMEHGGVMPAVLALLHLGKDQEQLPAVG